jgi:hypothetical protein
MISAVAFACVSSDEVSISGIEFTPELKASLGLSHLGSMIRKPLDDDTIAASSPGKNTPKQRLQRVHTTAARIALPPLSLKRNRSLGGITDILINFDCLGVCFHEIDGPGEMGVRPANGTEPNGVCAAKRGNNGGADAAATNGHNPASNHSPFSLIKKPHDLLRSSRAFGRDRVLRIASRHKIKAVMLIEPPDPARESRICLYTNPDAGDEVEKAFQFLSSVFDA